MKHPAYNLRPNKAIDRFLLVETIQRLSKVFQVKEYTYHGFGGPFLDDCRLMGQYFPDLQLRSIERNSHTFKRQRFHLPSKNLKLHNESFESYLGRFTGTGKHIFWIDYTDFRYACFDEFLQVLDKVEDGSVLKVTFRAELDSNPFVSTYPDKEQWVKNLQKDFLDSFRAQFEKVLPGAWDERDLIGPKFFDLIQKMIQIGCQRILPPATERSFQLLSSCFYNDQTAMLSLTGIVCSNSQKDSILAQFKGWKEANLDWSPPRRIDVPNLSLKERLLLDKHLPRKKAGATALAKSLGYNIADSGPATERQLEQYSSYYRYYPMFAKIGV